MLRRPKASPQNQVGETRGYPQVGIQTPMWRAEQGNAPLVVELARRSRAWRATAAWAVGRSVLRSAARDEGKRRGTGPDDVGLAGMKLGP
jgi:hypothetical protein